LSHPGEHSLEAISVPSWLKVMLHGPTKISIIRSLVVMAISTSYIVVGLPDEAIQLPLGLNAILPNPQPYPQSAGSLKGNMFTSSPVSTSYKSIESLNPYANNLPLGLKAETLWCIVPTCFRVCKLYRS